MVKKLFAIGTDTDVGKTFVTAGIIDILRKNNILDVDIPFLSKDDEFSVTLYVENQCGEHNKH